MDSTFGTEPLFTDMKTFRRKNNCLNNPQQSGGSEPTTIWFQVCSQPTVQYMVVQNKLIWTRDRSPPYTEKKPKNLKSIRTWQKYRECSSHPRNSCALAPGVPGSRMSWSLLPGLPALISTNLGSLLPFLSGSLLHAFCEPELWDTALLSG